MLSAPDNIIHPALPRLFLLFRRRHVGPRVISGLHNQPSIEDDQLEIRLKPPPDT